jgi:HK97 family phage portal protein
MWNWRSLIPWGKERAVEGQFRPGPYWVNDPGGGLISVDAGRYWNWWQTGYRPAPFPGRSAMVEACVGAYSQTVAMCPGDHWRVLSNGGRERVTSSALQRIIKAPNDYQSISDFLLNLTRRLFEHGEAFALATRNNRGEVGELHLMRTGMAVLGEDGSIWYSLQGNEIIQQRLDISAEIPARDVLHVRLHTPRHPLRGESPILAATLQLQMQGAALSQQVQFYLNQARPSFLLKTPLVLNREKMQELRAYWDEQTQGENAGRTPIMNAGLEAQPIQTNAVDAQLAEMMKMTEQDIALAHRIPLQILGLGSNTFSSTELLMQSWIASGLGFVLNHIEEAFGLLFRLKGQPDEYLEFDTRALLRSAYRERIEALARGVISGIYSPDEARAEVELPAVPGGVGAMPRVQQQVVPLSYGADLQPPSPTPALPPPSDTTPPDSGEGSDTNAGDNTASQLASLRAGYDRALAA